MAIAEEEVKSIEEVVSEKKKRGRKPGYKKNKVEVSLDKEIVKEKTAQKKKDELVPGKYTEEGEFDIPADGTPQYYLVDAGNGSFDFIKVYRKSLKDGKGGKKAQVLVSTLRPRKKGPIGLRDRERYKMLKGKGF